jgi:hypothetical protein
MKLQQKIAGALQNLATNRDNRNEIRCPFECRVVFVSLSSSLRCVSVPGLVDLTICTQQMRGRQRADFADQNFGREAAEVRIGRTEAAGIQQPREHARFRATGLCGRG